MIDDAVHEGTESMLLFLTSISGAMYDDTLAVGVIDDDDEAPTEDQADGEPFASTGGRGGIRRSS